MIEAAEIVESQEEEAIAVQRARAGRLAILPTVPRYRLCAEPEGVTDVRPTVGRTSSVT